MKVAFDLDGTLYNTLPVIFDVDQTIRTRLGYAPITPETYVGCFQTSDWPQLYRDLGIRDEHIHEVIESFVAEFGRAPLPRLIPGAAEALCTTEKAIGTDNIYVITNEPKPRVQLRFERDGLMHFFARVETPYEGKANELIKLSSEDPSRTVAYVGDLVSDGEACRTARERGADVRFYGIVHPYAMNNRTAMETFVRTNSGFAQTLNSLEEVSHIWTPK